MLRTCAGGHTGVLGDVLQDGVPFRDGPDDGFADVRLGQFGAYAGARRVAQGQAVGQEPPHDHFLEGPSREINVVQGHSPEDHVHPDQVQIVHAGMEEACILEGQLVDTQRPPQAVV